MSREAEIQTLGRIRHRHIVRLLGFCSNHETNLLVYKYMPNGSLGEVLHGTKGSHLHWDTRYKIAVEATKGLCYLHHNCSPLILHMAVKSNNILLDSNFEAHFANFGLAKFLQDSGTSKCMSAIACSHGYIAPAPEVGETWLDGHANKIEEKQCEARRLIHDTKTCNKYRVKIGEDSNDRELQGEEEGCVGEVARI